VVGLRNATGGARPVYDADSAIGDQNIAGVIVAVAEPVSVR
jgi:hypothetical protein